jgi:hypothetical protein
MERLRSRILPKTMSQIGRHEQRRSTRRYAIVLEMKDGPSGSVIRLLIPIHRESRGLRLLACNRADSMRRLVWEAFALISLTLAATTSAQAEKRIALVIGNGAYKNVPKLPNPTNDSAAMADLLHKAGFQRCISFQQVLTAILNVPIRFRDVPCAEPRWNPCPEPVSEPRQSRSCASICEWNSARRNVKPRGFLQFQVAGSRDVFDLYGAHMEERLSRD